MKTVTHDGAVNRSLASDMARVAVAVALILLVPLVAMAFTREVNWTGSDFAVAAVLLAGAGSGLVAISRKLAAPRKRLLARVALAVAFLLLWAELAVGIVGSPIAGS